MPATATLPRLHGLGLARPPVAPPPATNVMNYSERNAPDGCTY